MDIEAIKARDGINASIKALSTVSDICDTYEALLTLADVTCGLISQPRFIVSKTSETTPGGEVLENLLEYLNREVDGLAEAAKKATPRNHFEKCEKESLIISHEIKAGASAVNIAALALSLVSSDQASSVMEAAE